MVMFATINATDTRSGVITAARKCRDLGFSVLPLADDKKPAWNLLPQDDNKKPTWKLFQQRLPSHSEIDEWSAGQGPASFGTITGSVSGNLLAIDFDVIEFFAKFRDALKAASPDIYGKLRRAVQVRTRRGIHLLMRCQAPVMGNEKLAYALQQIPADARRDMRGKFEYVNLGDKAYPVVNLNGSAYAQVTAIETRGEGGYVVAPPSPSYTVERGDYEDMVVLSSEELSTLLGIARSVTDLPITEIRQIHGLTTNGDMERNRPGDEYNLRGDVLGLMYKHGWEFVSEYLGRTYLRRPGKTEDVSATFNFDSSNSLYVFSTNATPFEAGVAYSPFAVRALLDHDGDYAACASACRKDGFGGETIKTTTITIGSTKTEMKFNWEDILPIGFQDLGAFPAEIFPSDLRAFVESAAYSIQVPMDAIGMMVLSATSTLVAKAIEVEIKSSYHEPLNLWTCVVMQPASRKSAAHSLVITPVMSLESSIIASQRDEIRRYQTQLSVLRGRRQDLIKQLEKDNNPEIEAQLEVTDAELAELVPVNPTTIWLDDSTPESLACKMAENSGRMSIMSAEGGVFDLMAGRYSAKPNLDVYLKGHAGDALRVSRKGGSSDLERMLTVDSPALSVGVMVQPDVLSTLSAKGVMLGRGVMARFLYAYPTNLVGSRLIDTPDIPKESMACYERYIQALGALRPNQLPNDWSPRTLRLSAEARVSYFGWAMEVERRLADDLSQIDLWAGKLAGATVRVAGLLHILHNANNPSPWEVTISGQTMERAILFARYCIPHAFAAHQKMHADPAVSGAQRLLDWIIDKKAEQFTPRDIQRSIRSMARVESLNAPLALLAEHGYLRPMALGGGNGQKRQAYEVNPAVFALTVPTQAQCRQPEQAVNAVGSDDWSSATSVVIDEEELDLPLQWCEEDM